jgi:hypothetical protein
VRGERTSWLASVWLSKPTVCEKRPAPFFERVTQGFTVYREN